MKKEEEHREKVRDENLPPEPILKKFTHALKPYVFIMPAMAAA